MSKEQPKPTVDAGKAVSDSAEVEIQSIPVANVRARRVDRAVDWTSSYLWLISILCLFIAMSLVWWSLPQRGVAIEIHFPEGHGLESEDSVRFRGIDVGVVEEVKLNSDLTGVDVRVNLKPFAASLAREGTRFWIVRPELSLAGISGLETAVGHKYIGLIPADPTAPRAHSFDGLGASPADAFALDGMEIIIRGEKKHSVNTGSPVTCRGVEIGRVLSVGLSQDGRFVDVRARIFEKFTKLVSTKSKFWATSGMDLEFSFGNGIKLDIESLETIALGGVSMLTTENGGQPIKPGEVFTLHQKPADEWYKTANLVRTTDVELRGVVPLEIRWQQSGLLGTSNKTANGNGIPLKSDDGALTLLVPTDLLTESKNQIAGSLKILAAGQISEPVSLSDLPIEDPNGKLRKIRVPTNFSRSSIDNRGLRPFTAVEDCLAVRASGTANELTYLHYPIEVKDVTSTELGWLINNFDGTREVWHGCPVLAAVDGKLIGVLLIENRQALIVPLPAN